MHSPRPALTDDILSRFATYYRTHDGWGSLHCVLSGLNVQDKFVRTCFDYAVETDDPVGAALASLLLELSQTQRRRIAWRAPSFLN